MSACSCDPATYNGTSLRIRVELDGVTVTQLRFNGSSGSDAVFGPDLRPAVPGAPLESGGSLLVLLKDEHAGKLVRVDVEGLAEGRVIAAGFGEATVVRGREVEARVVLRETPAGCDGGSCNCGSGGPCQPGQTCVGGRCACTGTSCPDGCCSGDECRAPSFTTCGKGGSACVVCPSSNTNACNDGECGCGAGGACGVGQQCVDGMCRCTPASCPSGCCNGDVCETGDDASACGSAGSACAACPAGDSCNSGVCSSCAATCVSGCCTGATCRTPDPMACGQPRGACLTCDEKKSNACTNGMCRCGTGPACGAGQSCVNDTCVCDPTSCPSGCCAGTTCITPTLASCGTGGGACMSCDTRRADRCSTTGACACGPGPACAAGQRCVAGTCRCDADSCAGCCSGSTCLTGDEDATCGAAGRACDACDGGACTGGTCGGCAASCATGCCSGNTCLPPSLASCGTAGAACTACDMSKADSCTNGECRCGTDSACSTGQRCLAGLCVCDDLSCPGGCCMGSACTTRELATCGRAGATCVACNPMRADNCSALGACQCGAGPACSSGQTCESGVCACDAASCPNGCCEGNVCRPRSLMQCGTAGGICGRCDAMTSDSCSAQGACMCGAGSACAAGQRCVGGSCSCDATSCTGCCTATGACVTATSATACGAAGSECMACPAAETCTNGICSGCAASCTNGCCTGSTCNTRSLGTCGPDRGACQACDPLRADSCSAGGACQCGAGGMCSAGQQCVGGTCQCTAASCPDGCCDLNEACRPRTLAACGTAGAACSPCDGLTADSCSVSGTCQCGTGAACALGQHCVAGNCVCDATSCSGCCSGTTCNPNPDRMSCGAGASACVACELTRADSCTSGTCRCGIGAQCGPGQRCMGGTCVCDAMSCKNGCCSASGQCLPGNTDAACGVGGGACSACTSPQTCVGGACGQCDPASCPSGCCGLGACQTPSVSTCGKSGLSCVACGAGADQCVDGRCQCGSGPACGAGQRCLNGACACDAMSCPNGCCDGLQCRAQSLAACGAAGGACMSCDTVRADTCSASGECRCGTGAACGAGTRCSGGTCVCDQTSCPNGCCQGGVCQVNQLSQCGTGGGSCSPCGPRADNCANGVCMCGSGAPCSPGTRCPAGSCACDSATCAGCCDGATCRNGTQNASCGTMGAMCQDCSPGTCSGGACTGGSCSAGTCPNGCCSSNTCMMQSTTTCGTSGGPCTVCDPARSDQCTSGACRCGTLAQCAVGKRCLMGQCVCDSISCQGCCTGFGNCAPGTAETQCGTDGGRCENCNGPPQCIMGRCQ